MALRRVFPGGYTLPEKWFVNMKHDTLVLLMFISSPSLTDMYGWTSGGPVWPSLSHNRTNETDETNHISQHPLRIRDTSQFFLHSFKHQGAGRFPFQEAEEVLDFTATLAPKQNMLIEHSHTRTSHLYTHGKRVWKGHALLAWVMCASCI